MKITLQEIAVLLVVLAMSIMAVGLVVVMNDTDSQTRNEKFLMQRLGRREKLELRRRMLPVIAMKPGETFSGS